MVDVSQWFKMGRITDRGVRVLSDQEAEAEEREAEKFVAARTAARDHGHVVVDADFRVTWFLDCGREGDPEVVDAAFRFLLSRYDLKVGFWDLVRDRGLRESLLTPEELAPPPERPLKMPQEMASAAAAAESQRVAKKRSEDAARTTLHNILWPLLKERKWKTWETKLDGTKSHPGTEYHVPLGKEIRWSPGFPTAPVLYYSLKVHKEQSVLRLATPPLAFTGVAEYLEAHAQLLEAGVGKPPTGDVLWRFAGLGWEGDPTQWAERITVIDRITEILAPDLSNLRDAALANHTEMSSSWVERSGTAGAGGAG
jgi:hypothetical protein